MEDRARRRSPGSPSRRLAVPRARALVLALLAAALLADRAEAANPARLELRPDDHISIIGNTLAERMQHHGWLETRLQARFREHRLVVRNLGFSGDELTIRLRSAGFGSLDDHLHANRTSVILAFFGFNESFAGPGCSRTSGGPPSTPWPASSRRR